MTQPPPPIPAPHNRWLIPILRALFRFRWAVLALCLAVFALCLFWSLRLGMRENVLDLLPAQDPLVAQYQQILTDFGQMNTMLVEVGPARKGQAPGEDALIAAADRVAEAMAASPHFKQITYRLDAAALPELLSTLRAHRASLFSAADEAQLRQKLAPDSIRQTLAGWKRQLLESPAPFLAPSLARDPLGLDALLLAKVSAAYSLDGPITLNQGRFFSRDLRHILIMAEPVHPATDSEHAQALVGFMDQLAASTERAAPGGGLKVAYLCGHRMSLENASRIKRDVQWTLALCVLAIAAVALLVYRRPLWVMLTFLPTLFGGVIALGLLRWLAPGLSIIAVGCGSMLMGIAVDLGIHILYHVDQAAARRPRVEEIIAILDRLFWPLILCSSTTVVAFLALLWSVLPGYRDLGLFAVLGFSGATFFAMFILPLLIPLRGKVRTVREPLLPAARWFPAFFAWSARRRRLLVALLVILSLGAIPGLTRLRFEGDYQKMNAISPAVRADWDRIIALFGAALNSTSVVVRGQNLEESLRQSEQAYTILKGQQEQGTLASVESITPLLPSARTQQANTHRWQAFWSADRLARLRADLGRAGAEVRLKPGVFGHFLGGLPGPAEPLKLIDLQGGLLGRLVTLHVARAADGRVPVLTSMKLANAEAYPKVFAALKQSGVPFVAFHGPQFVRYVMELIYREMAHVSLITIALVLLILIAHYRAPGRILLILAPLLINLLWTFGLMGWFGMKVNLMNSMIVVFIFGVVVDYSVFLAESIRTAGAADDPHLNHSSVAIVMSAITTMIGLGVLAVARHPALYSIGMTSLLGIGSGLLAVFLVIPLAKRYTR